MSKTSIFSNILKRKTTLVSHCTHTNLEINIDLKIRPTFTNSLIITIYQIGWKQPVFAGCSLKQIIFCF